jgi:hypothetical protein
MTAASRPTIYYMRHGETDWNVEGRLQYRRIRIDRDHLAGHHVFGFHGSLHYLGNIYHESRATPLIQVNLVVCA